MNQAPTPPLQSRPSGDPPAHASALASLICGIASLVCCALPAAVAAIICSRYAKKQGNTSTMAKAGFILGTVGTALSALAIVVGILIVLLGGLGDTIYAQVTGIQFYQMESGNYAVYSTTAALPEHVVIPETYRGKPVTVIAADAFRDQTDLVSVTIPDGVSRISTRAFSGCTSLERVSIPASVGWIDRYAFFGCSSLVEIDLPDRLNRLGSYAFKNCSSLTSIVVPAEVAADQKDAYGDWQSIFENCTSLKTATLLNSQPVVKAMFMNCTSLTEVRLSPNITAIEENAFENCSSLSSFTFHEGLEAIGSCAFENCALTEVLLPETVKSIGRRAFKGCIPLTRIILPSEISDYGYDVFLGCESIVYFKGNSVAITTDSPCTEHVVTMEITGIGGLTGSLYLLDFPALTELTIRVRVHEGFHIFAASLPKLTTIHFEGTQAQWREVSPHHWDASPNTDLTVHCTDGDIVYRAGS